MTSPVVIEMGSKTRAFGAIVPDLPGCFTGGDTSDEALSRAAKALTQWIKDAIENGHNVLRPSLLVHLRAGRDWAGPVWVWGFASQYGAVRRVGCAHHDHGAALWPVRADAPAHETNRAPA
ncbi:hypothetical protein C0V97_11865 [Asaia sp. W19]|nr:hypothetical protein C0V97_11865 [Asaia sp. W19]